MSSTNNTIYCEYGDCWEWDDSDESDIPTREYLIQPFDNTPTGRYKKISGNLLLCPICDGVGRQFEEKNGAYIQLLCRSCDGMGILRTK